MCECEFTRNVCISCRVAWKEYFEAEGSISVAFWSALAQNSQENACTSQSDSVLESATDTGGKFEEATTELLGETATTSDDTSAACVSQDAGSDACRLLTRDELTKQLLSISPVSQGQVTTVGMVRMFENIGVLGRCTIIVGCNSLKNSKVWYEIEKKLFFLMYALE